MKSEPQHINEIWNRPDGTNAASYKALVDEGRHRLAWEWLIRIPKFQSDCQAVHMGSLDASATAAAWGLYRFKPFYEPYSTPRKPRFLVSKVSLFRAKLGQLVRHIPLRPGEMAFVFNVERMVFSLDSRDAQIATMVQLLDAEIERQRDRQVITPEAKSRANVTHLDACLQLADLLHRDVPADKIKLEIPYLRDVKEKGTEHGRYRDMKARIAELTVGGGYLVLASRAHTKKK